MESRIDCIWMWGKRATIRACFVGLALSACGGQEFSSGEPSSGGATTSGSTGTTTASSGSGGATGSTGAGGATGSAGSIGSGGAAGMGARVDGGDASVADALARDVLQEPRSCTVPSECPMPPSQCVTASCTGGMCGTTLQPGGTRCANGAKFCDSAGACVDCFVATDCPGLVTECYRKQCIGGQCSIGPRPPGDLCNGMVDQCDGSGNCVDCVDNGGCAECCVCSANHCIPASFGK
jgi:hypothetical protein